MINLILSQSYSPIENNELSFEFNYSNVNYSPQLSNELSLIENSNTLTDNINFDINQINYDNALYEVFGNNHRFRK